MSAWSLRRRRIRPVGTTLESGGEGKGTTWRESRLLKALIIAALVGIGMLAYPRQRVYEFPVEVGEVWRDADLISPQAFPIFKTREELQSEIQAIRASARPVFREETNSYAVSIRNLDSLGTRLDRLFRQYAAWQSSKLRSDRAQVVRDSIAFRQAMDRSNISLTRAQWKLLLDSYAERVPGLTANRRTPVSARRLDEELLAHVRLLITRYSDKPVINVGIDNVLTEEIIVLNERDRTQRFIPRSDLIDPAQLTRELMEYFDGVYPSHPDTARVGRALFRQVFRPQLTYLSEATEARIQDELSRISTTRGLVREGEVIVRNGEVVTEEVQTKLNSLARSLAERGGQVRAWLILLGQFVMTLIAFTIFYLFLFILRRRLFNDNRDVLLMSFLLATIVGLYAAAVRFENVPDLAVPVAIASILLTVFYDSRVGIFATLSLAILGGIYFGNDFKFTSVTIFAGTLAVFSVRDIKRRAPFVTTAGLVLLAYALMLSGFWLFDVIPLGKGILTEFILIGINSVLVLLAQPLVLIFERLFRMTTDVTLLELSDTNRDLLRELSIKAPGSFNHSLQVANLAEAAADAIGANALLARVGALYHDIGKMQKPEYFVENQRSGYNPHDRLKPRMSALIIGSHVRDGVDLGRQGKVPEVILDFITMHHGTARMEYFYNKGLQMTEEGEQPPSESEFRYPGPRPNTRETGVVMLADSVEAASRSIEQPTARKLESMVNSIFESRIADGQLDNCPLTFAEINTVKGTLLSMLSGIHHFRVKYPGQEEMEGVDREGLEVDAGEPESEDKKPPSEMEASSGSEGTPEHVE